MIVWLLNNVITYYYFLSDTKITYINSQIIHIFYPLSGKASLNSFLLVTEVYKLRKDKVMSKIPTLHCLASKLTIFQLCSNRLIGYIPKTDVSNDLFLHVGVS